MVFSKLSGFFIRNLRSPCSSALQICLNTQLIVLAHGREGIHKLLSVHSLDADKAVLRQIIILYQKNTLFVLFLLCHSVHLQFRQPVLNACNQLRSCLSYGIEGRFQFLHILAAAPACDITKGIIRGINPEPLAYRISNALRFHFLCSAVFSFRIFYLLIQLPVMQFCM